jgi:hypothetical protein
LTTSAACETALSLCRTLSSAPVCCGPRLMPKRGGGSSASCAVGFGSTTSAVQPTLRRPRLAQGRLPDLECFCWVGVTGATTLAERTIVQDSHRPRCALVRALRSYTAVQ